MGLIAVEGMRFYAYHGFYDEEQKIGQEYVVDAYVDTDFKKAAKGDDLFKTINYETIYLSVKIEMSKPTRLLETLASRIADSLKNKFANIKEIRIRVAKLYPPLGGEVVRTFVEFYQDHRKKCAKTGDKMLCYKDDNCWCKELRINEDTLKMLDDKYSGCLSPDVLALYAAPGEVEQ